MRGRGRGRGSRGGRGRVASRGRGVSRNGRLGSRSQYSRSRSHSLDENTEPTLDNVKSFFIGNVSFEQHYKAQEESRDRYAAGIATVIESGMDIVQSKLLIKLAQFSFVYSF